MLGRSCLPCALVKSNLSNTSRSFALSIFCVCPNYLPRMPPRQFGLGNRASKIHHHIEKSGDRQGHQRPLAMWREDRPQRLRIRGTTRQPLGKRNLELVGQQAVGLPPHGRNRQSTVVHWRRTKQFTRDPRRLLVRWKTTPHGSGGVKARWQERTAREEKERRQKKGEIGSSWVKSATRS